MRAIDTTHRRLPNSILASWRRRPEETRGYAVAGVAVVFVALLGAALRPYLERSNFILFAAPVALTAWYGGRGPALLATVLGLLGADIVFLKHTRFFLPSVDNDFVAAAAFVVVSLTIVHMSTLLRNARAEAQRNASALQAQTEELEQQTQEAQTLSEELEEAHEELKNRAQSQLAEAQSLARLGSWEWDIEHDTIKWSDEMYRLFGFEPGTVEIDYDRYRSMLHPEDRDIAGEHVRHSLETGSPFSFDHRVILPDGAERIFHARGRVVKNDDGKAVRMFGTGQDVTETRRASAALQSAAEYAARQATAEAAAQHLNRVFAQAPVLITVLA